jgi:hypothetical protein
VVAVVDAQAAAGAVLARLGDVGAQLVDHQAYAAGGDAGDPLAGLRVGRVVVVGAQQRVDELCRPLDYADQPRSSPAVLSVSGLLARALREAVAW